MHNIASRALALLLGFSTGLPVAAVADPVAPSGDRARVDASLDKTYPALDALYRDIHQHPELAFQENRTAALLAARMRALGFTVTERVGKTGVVAVLKNGDGPTVLVRTEMDALPLLEKTGLPFASTAQALLAMKDRWHGTLVFVAQPAEEIISGGKAMIADGLLTRFPHPDFAFAAHVGPELAGTVTIKQGVMSSASDTVAITFHGIGVHGSMPDKGIDPIVEGVHFVEDVQTVISRQKDPQKFGVITVGSFNAGTVANIIPDHADLQLTLRAFDPEVRTLLNEGVATTAKAVADMARAPAPDVRHLFGAAPVRNDPALSARAAAFLGAQLGSDRIRLVPAYLPGGSSSEDYSEIVDAGIGQSVYFSVGGYEAATIARFKREGKPLPVNHSPFFAPAAEPSIRTGVETLTLAVLMVAGAQ